MVVILDLVFLSYIERLSVYRCIFWTFMATTDLTLFLARFRSITTHSASSFLFLTTASYFELFYHKLLFLESFLFKKSLNLFLLQSVSFSFIFIQMTFAFKLIELLHILSRYLSCTVVKTVIIILSLLRGFIRPVVSSVSTRPSFLVLIG